MFRRTNPDQMMISCGPIRVLVPNVKINVSSDQSRRGDVFMWSHQSLCPQCKNQCFVGPIPMTWWFHVVPSECFPQCKNQCFVGPIPTRWWFHVIQQCKNQCLDGPIPTTWWFHVVPSECFPQCKNQCFIGPIPTTWWFHVVPSECLSPMWNQCFVGPIPTRWWFHVVPHVFPLQCFSHFHSVVQVFVNRRTCWWWPAKKYD